MKCCICFGEIEKKFTPDFSKSGGEMYWDKGNNPFPVSSKEDDRCCDTCNATVVIPSRMNTLFEKQGGRE